ncbi:MAG: hypothetical protein HYT37_02340 [Candidatus Sungbacteria bacterium]|nr:hypothetical protein [Candidatus Sungbacteria bacterium]
MKTPVFLENLFSRNVPKSRNLNLLVTLWPTFPHFARFTHDPRIAGVRLNSAMIASPELDEALRQVGALDTMEHLWFDFKGRQLRVAEVHTNEYHLDITLNHPIKVDTPTIVLFKAGADSAVLDCITENGTRLIFKEGAIYGPKKFMVGVGESLHIRHPSFQMLGNDFSQSELEKIEKVRQFGFTQYYLSYVETRNGINKFIETVGQDARIKLKIETRAGLEFVAHEFKKTENLSLMAACGDLYVEIEKPHHIMDALKLIIGKDPEACAGSRLMLSVGQPLATDVKKAIEHLQKIGENAPIDTDEIKEMLKNLTEPQIPSCADFLQLSWLYDIGYRSMMLCDELCLRENLLAVAVNAFDAFRNAHAK